VNDSLVTANPFLKAWQNRTPADLLLLLEWMLLLGGFLANLVLPAPFQTLSGAPSWSSIQLFQVPFMIVFGLMGLKRPKQSLFLKTLYTIAEFGLVYLPTILDASFFYIFPPFHLIIVIRSCSMFGKVGQLITAIVGNLLFFTAFSSQKATIIDFNSTINIEQFSNMLFAAQLSATFGFILISTFILLLTNTLLFVQRSRQELSQAHDRLRQYALQIEDQAMLQERNRIAREMHDALGHALIAQNLQLETVHCFWNSDPDKAARALSEAKHLGSQALHDVRQAVSTLRGNALQGLSLDEAIAKLIQTFYQTTGILPSCTFRLAVVSPKAVNLCVYRVVQEAFTNIAKHSHATEVSIYLQASPKQLNILIQDNGIGFEPSQNTSGFGLQGMEERILALDGLFSVVSQAGLGCKIMAQIPLAELQSIAS
jgi:signal transduction histidine kinase